MLVEPARSSFSPAAFFPRALYEEITSIRVSRPQIILRQAQARVRRRTLAPDGKLAILAADHPARRMIRVGNEPFRIGNRYEYLARIIRVLTSGEIDGIMGTTDVIEELFVAQYLMRRDGGEAFLDGKVILGCMNRGGIAGTVFELDDRFTSFTAESLAQMHLDGAKLMFRLKNDDQASGLTIEYCARAIDDLNKHHLAAFLEALAVEQVDGQYRTVKNADTLVEIVGIGSALGNSSRYLWLKIPYCDDYARVANATTLPILILGGEAAGDPSPLLRELANGMQASSNVRGALVGRNVLYPGEYDPMIVGQAVARVVHNQLQAQDAILMLGT